jgi:hypothetical protein
LSRSITLSTLAISQLCYAGQLPAFHELKKGGTAC